ncbi:hypothetical protein NCS57_01462400 [Fusarium keratoplasticum]|uniref:Uncharacterized protein n=1 Tax=Fusarium keratoplasticum TaxID=1328300 RepID=A0ACC0QD92_9HYPO|nr:hypothetical protein NCS57_01462400 [Fusarium keratoplasticum]KAI8649258.1 hypothetical protein NCS57_01462400 [Fusarium keratoplasticum]KAI8649646.1 hypothetical protein NCS55_01465100 [Fusarium keratoplasticum]
MEVLNYTKSQGKSVEEPRVVLLQLSDSTDPNLLTTICSQVKLRYTAMGVVRIATPAHNTCQEVHTQ